jgi:hypothetical protein
LQRETNSTTGVDGEFREDAVVLAFGIDRRPEHDEIGADNAAHYRGFGP